MGPRRDIRQQVGPKDTPHIDDFDGVGHNESSNWRCIHKWIESTKWRDDQDVTK